MSPPKTSRPGSPDRNPVLLNTEGDIESWRPCMRRVPSAGATTMFTV